MKVLVLGHKGMLGNMVYKYLSTKEDCELITTDLRWPSEDFKNFAVNFDGDFIVNCIGAIHQKKTNFSINTDLPIWLDMIKGNFVIIHPSTDCEMGSEYGDSKRNASDYIKENGLKTIIIKTSVIGSDLNSKNSLLEWFLNSKEEVFGYSDVYWNGNTTLQWAKISYDMMKNNSKHQNEYIFSSSCISKYKLLNLIKEVYEKDINILKCSKIKINNCLVGGTITPSIKKQLKEMREFYYDN